MDNTYYTTGSWLGMVGHGAVVVLEAGTDPAILEHLWHHLGQGPTIHSLLHEVTEQFGTALADLPSFAILVHGERLHAILRGDITLAARTAGGSELVSGREVTTWSERSLPLPESLELTLAETPDVGQPPALVLPVAEAVVCLQSLQICAGVPGFFRQESPATAQHGGPGAGPAAGPRDAAAGLTGDRPDGARAEGRLEAGGVDGGELGEGRPDEADHAFDESFAMAAEAEWNAQLAPLDVPGAIMETDLGRTIRPDNSEDGPDMPAAHRGQHGWDEAEPAGTAERRHAQGEAAPDAGRAETGPSGTGADAADPAGGQAADAAQDLAEDGFTTNYDFLFGATVAQSVEDAAVRPGAAQQSEPLVPPLPTQPPQAGSNTPAPEDGAAEEQAAAPGPGPGLLIDSVPWATAARQPAEEDDPDHDGHTVLRGQVQQEALPEPETEALPVPRPATGPVVLARVCPNGHANPPSLPNCFSCGETVTAEPRTVGRPCLGTMHISNGEVVELEHSLIIGRQPSVSRVMGEAMPRLVRVDSGNDDISRSHVEVRLDGWDVLLVDLKATNGTVLVREGQAPRRLGQGEEAILLNGDIAELGDGVTLQFDGLL